MAKGILAILGKPSKEGPDDEMDDDEAPDSEGGKGASKAGERASQDLIDAVGAGDAKAVYEAMERIVAACHMGGEE